MSLAQKLLLLTTQWADIPSPPGSGCPRKKCTALVSLVSLDLCSQCGGTNPCLAQKWISERWCLVLCMCNRSLVLSLRQHSATSLEQSLTLKKKKKKAIFHVFSSSSPADDCCCHNFSLAFASPSTFWQPLPHPAPHVPPCTSV